MGKILGNNDSETDSKLTVICCDLVTALDCWVEA